MFDYPDKSNDEQEQDRLAEIGDQKRDNEVSREQDTHDKYTPRIQQLKAELAEALNQVEELKKDKERLDWLVAFYADTSSLDFAIRFYKSHKVNGLRQAIDAAMNKL